MFVCAYAVRIYAPSYVDVEQTSMSLDACYMCIVNRRVKKNKIWKMKDLMLVNTAHPIIPARPVEGMTCHSSPYQAISLERRGS